MLLAGEEVRKMAHVTCKSCKKRKGMQNRRMNAPQARRNATVIEGAWGHAGLLRALVAARWSWSRVHKGSGTFRVLTAARIFPRILLQSRDAELRCPLGLIRASVFG